MIYKTNNINEINFKIQENCFLKYALLFLFFFVSILVEAKSQHEKVEFLKEKNNELIEENLRIIDSAIVMAYRLNDKSILSEAYLEKGNYFLEQRNYNNALKNFTISNQLSKKIKDEFNLYSSYIGIAQTKEKQNQLEESIALYEKSLTYFKLHKSDPKSFKKYLFSLGKLSYLNSRRNQIKKSEFYNDLELKETIDTVNYQYALKNKGIIDFYKKDYINAFSKLKHAQQTFIQQNDVEWYVITEQYLGEILYQQQNKNEAILYFRNVVEMSKKYRIVNEELRLSYERVLEFTEEFGNKNEQLNSVNNLLSFDSLFYTNDKIVLKPNTAKYENTLLKSERNQLTEKNKTIKYSAFTGFALIVCFGGISMYKVNQNHKRKKANLLSYIDELKAKTKYSESINSHPKTKKNIELDPNLELGLKSFEERKLFLIPKISLNDLAKELNTNRSVVSNYINRSRQKNFNQYINQLRIDNIVERLINEPNLQKYTIDALAEETGFNSRKTFSDAFLEHTGFRPSDFIRNFSA